MLLLLPLLLPLAVLLLQGVDVAPGEAISAGLLLLLEGSSRLLPPLDFRELLRLETRLRLSISESRMGGGGPPVARSPLP
jgi:hypothetical protein